MSAVTQLPRPLKVFLSYSRHDQKKVVELYERLKKDGFDVWLDVKSLLPGQQWGLEIRNAVQSADVVAVCLSNSAINERGYLHQEIIFALDEAAKQPEGTIFLIPVRLEECTVPTRLNPWQWVDLYADKGYKLLKKSLFKRAKELKRWLPKRQAPLSTPRSDLADYQDYSWIPYMSYRYLESLDSARFNILSSEHHIRLLNGKSELLEALLFGDAIVLSENQLADSRGAIEALSELISAADEMGVRVRVRVASRTPDISVFKLAANLVGNTGPKKRYVISANPELDVDSGRRKKWAECLSKGYAARDDLLKLCLSSEVKFTEKWFEVLKYIDSQEDLVVPASNNPMRFYKEIEQILGLTDEQLENMCMQTVDADVPEIVHPQWFESEEESNAAKELMEELRRIIKSIGGIPRGRSPIYTELAQLEKSKPDVAAGLKEITDSIYNHVVGLAVNADSISDTTGDDTRNIYIRAGHALAQWARQTEQAGKASYQYELPWGWGGVSKLVWSDAVTPSQVKAILNVVPWHAILDGIVDPQSNWFRSLVELRVAMEQLQAIDRPSILFGSIGELWKQRHLDARKRLNATLLEHIQNTAKAISKSNKLWSLAEDGFRFSQSGESDDSVLMRHYFRIMGTPLDYPLEYALFREKVQEFSSDLAIYGMVSQLAKKRFQSK